ncbi:cell wall hydrolase [Halarsenatibacter silvermanii]|uniref:N-acetylmuramoyl-L-alanine amidase n=1 Tax=Halarsenatibacter silvermanii TaxID=321763 RepID=A0A1G9LIS6_9FIRM|nr:cell wall hydrolase [Halarsenatibacter silvermanii]SDL61723.1 N-acetylmuramoyl-L-alanine amidase [Halarsenatibacter silvermanii]
MLRILSATHSGCKSRFDRGKLILTISLIFLVISCALLAETAETARYRLIYVVGEGDTLSQIAGEFGVSTSELAEWNGINNNSAVRIGSELEIPVRGEKTERNFDKSLTERENSFSLASDREMAVTVNQGSERPKLDHIDQSDLITYHVNAGDTLYDVARSFNTSMSVLRELNDMEDNTLRSGEEIVVPITELSEREALARSISDQEFELLSRIIHGEAQGEPHLGRVAVGAVVLNRVLSHRFPNSISEVIYDQGQFSPVQDGSYQQQPSADSRQAAREAINGKDPTGGALFFYNPDKATDREWTQRREKVVTIGNHVFMK